MKTNKGKVFVAFLCMMMCLSLNAQDLTPGMVVGMWNFSAPNAPYGYQEGTCQIRKTGENLSAVFTIGNAEMTVKEIKNALYKMLDKIPAEKLWVNPDCGLKTRGNAETVPSLENLVSAAKEIRNENF